MAARTASIDKNVEITPLSTYPYNVVLWLKPLTNNIASFLSLLPSTIGYSKSQNPVHQICYHVYTSGNVRCGERTLPEYRCVLNANAALILLLQLSFPTVLSSVESRSLHITHHNEIPHYHS